MALAVPVTFAIPGPLRAFTNGQDEVRVDVPALTLRDALDILGTFYPGLRDRLLTEQGDLRQHLNIFVGNDDIRYTGGLATPIAAGVRITILPAISGG